MIGRRLYHIVVFMIMMASAAAVVSTHRVFTQTWDEPAHVARGMQWLDQGTYTYFPEHPPLGPVLFATGPYLKGIRSFGFAERYEEGNEILHHDGNYAGNLAAARAGNLVFLLLAILVASLWSYQVWGPVAGVSSAMLLASLPPFLAHAGLATTDVPGAATFLLAAFAFWKWLEKPSPARAMLLGLAVGLALLGKLSNVGFIPVTFALLLGGHVLRRVVWREGRLLTGMLRHVLGLSLALVACGLVLWAGYRFSAHVLAFPDWGYGTPRGLQRVLRQTLEGWWMPFPAFFYGLDILLAHNRGGHPTYFLGEVVSKAPWYYFPLALLITTPLPLLLLASAGFVSLAWQAVSRGVPFRAVVPVLVLLGVLAVAIPSGINIGTRHILPVYFMLAVLAGFGAHVLWQARRVSGLPVGPVVVVALLAWHLAIFAHAHPDHLAYYNILGGDEPHELVFGTADWGQDTGRLVAYLRGMDVDHLHLCLHGSTDLTRFDLPPFSRLPPYEPVRGWVAINLLCERFGAFRAPYDHFSWLEEHRPHETIGRTIKVYYLPQE